jgi:branched-chain amino acid transport system permease protein
MSNIIPNAKSPWQVKAMLAAGVIAVLIALWRPGTTWGHISNIVVLLVLFYAGTKQLSTENATARLVGWGLIAVALIALPFAMQFAGTAWVRIANLAVLYVLLALGLNIVVGFAGLLDLGYIAFYAVGAYVYAFLASPHFGIQWPWYAVLPICAFAACVFGVLLGAPTLKLRGDYLAIVTLGFGEIVRIFMNNLSQPINITNGPKGIDSISAFNVLGVNLGARTEIAGYTISGPFKYYFFLLIALGLVVVINFRLQNSRIGRAWEAIREDEIAARAMGIDTTKIKLLAFAMGASFGGVAGGIFASIQQFISPESFTLVESVMVLSMVVLGGMGNIWGVVLGAVLLSFLPEFLRYTVEPVQMSLFGKTLIDAEIIRMLLFGFALVLMMLYRPAGLMPSAVRKRELTKENGNE